ncbi:hypothetical protein PCC9214_05699 [Planktothrix tepida]|uniref:Actin-like protein N-terminal domain-containing protein n=1 Tax=Planktothrix tepida PCC 9214 TaxID=671072 RepID=A0A1J1LTR3_9CYAN|nr:ParM/StbA family protein [Planktothrix tepida]CAD5990026.1 hypothetical protein PCC9214_05699 [Planktothrix tepida]CUR35598.1 conserved hypothetical protein [Planktothrix tepida PCC 9214]
MTKTSTNLTEPDITVAFDYGGSLTKIIFAGQDRQVRLLYMEPEVVSVPRESILGYARDQLGSADPQNTAWVAFRNDYRAVGYLAKQRFHANAGLSELKYERALHKTLAALWVIKEKQKLPGNFTVAIAALLPPGEYEDRSRFERVLREALADYQTPTGRMSVELLVFNCKPEGGGIYLMHNKKVGSGIKERVCAIAMIGYRNASLLVAQRGDVAPGKMSDLGFIRMVEKVLVKTSGQTAERLTPAIVTAGSEFKAAPLMRLARSTSREGRAEEVQQMLLAIKEARPEYVRSLTSWLDENLPPDCDELVFCGGTATYFKKELNEYYDRLPIIWNADISIPVALDKKGLGDRLSDVYGMFVYFRTVLKKQFNSKSYQSLESLSEGSEKQEVKAHG